MGSTIVLLVIAGREKLSSAWADYISLIYSTYLDALTEKESRELLASRGIVDSTRVELILKLSGRIPLWLATLASQTPQNPSDLLDPTEDAIDRFLKWVDHEAQRQAAVLCALPQHLDLDIIAVLLGETEARPLFDWLKTQPFVEQKAGEGWVYHDIVRNIMMRHLRGESRKDWTRLNYALADYYVSQRDALKLQPEAVIGHHEWKDWNLSYLYHKLCVDPENVTPILEAYIIGLKGPHDYQHRIGELAESVGLLLESAPLIDWGQQMMRGVEYPGENSPKLTLQLTLLTRMRRVLRDDSPQLPGLLSQTGGIKFSLRQYEEALADLTQAIKLEPQNTEHLIDRANVLRATNRSEEALADLNHAIQLEPNEIDHYQARASLFEKLVRYEEALDDHARAIALKPHSPHPLTLRARLLIRLERYDEALADYTQAIEFRPKDYVYSWRADLLRDIGRYGEAIEDYTRAIELKQEAIAQGDKRELKPGDRVIYVGPRDYQTQRGYTYYLMGGYNEALADYACALELEFNLSKPLTLRAILFEKLGRYEEATDDITRAIEECSREIKDMPGSIHALGALARRARLLKGMHRYEEALSDYTQLTELASEAAEAFMERHHLLVDMGHYEEALSDINHAIGLKPEAAQEWAFFQGQVLIHLGHFKEAFDRFNQVLQIHPEHPTILYHLAVVAARWRGTADAHDEIEKARHAIHSRHDANQSANSLYIMASLAALEGNINQALTNLQAAIASDPEAATWAGHDEAWTDLRSDNTFQGILSRSQKPRLQREE